MSDKNNSDNQNTRTTYIPPELKERHSSIQPEQYPRQRRRTNQRQQPNGSGVNPQYNRNPYGQGQYNGNQYGQGQYNGNPYGQGQYNGNPYGQGQYNGNPYGQGQYNGNPYGQGQYNGSPYGQGQYNGSPYGQGQYSEPPYEQPVRRQDSRQQQSGRNSGGYYPPPQRQTPKTGKSGGNKNSSSGKKSKKKRRKSGFSRFIIRLLLTVLVIFSILLLVYSCTVMSLIKKMEYVETGNRFRSENTLSRSYVTNVLLIGTDGRTDSDAGRSDTMIMASANSRTNKVSLISFMRDSYVEIPGYGWNKLNAAYSYGGAELLMDTIERNFGVRIDDYVSLNFVSFANIVDSVGGIDIDVTDAEMQEINTILQAEVNALMGDDVFDDLLDESGKLHLNGKQALSYARIRYVGNADFERTERQREVMELVMNKLKSLNPTIMPKLSASVLPGISTNINNTDMYFLSLKLPFFAGYERQQLQIPADGTYYDRYTDDGGQALGFDSEANFNLIYETAYSE